MNYNVLTHTCAPMTTSVSVIQSSLIEAKNLNGVKGKNPREKKIPIWSHRDISINK